MCGGCIPASILLKVELKKEEEKNVKTSRKQSKN